MQTCLKISAEYSRELERLNDTLHKLCDKIDQHGAWTLCFPKGGNLLTVIRLLSTNQVQYEIQVISRDE